MFLHVLADALTCCNLAAGISATFMKREGRRLRPSTLILLGATFDSLDGPLARRSGNPTDLGARGDGISDVISCGVAPAVLLAEQRRSRGDRLAWLAPRLYLMAIAWRVARYGFEPRTSHVFSGLPVTGAGVVVAIGLHLRLPPRVMSCLTLVVVAAMLSRLPVLSGEAMLRRRDLRANGYRISVPTRRV
jgi:CDP-diacylglycerol--serine O-phosphatidyltransferase